jgi:uroporphyrinogen-III synthase
MKHQSLKKVSSSSLRKTTRFHPKLFATTIIKVPPLTNKRILITRTRHQASDLAAQLEAFGATTLLIPTIEIVPPASYAPLDAALTQLETYDWLLFTSANAVEVFHQRLTSRSNRESDPPAPPNSSNSKLPKIAVATALTPHAPGSKMLLIRAAEARDYLPETLIAAGATVTITAAYRNQIPPDSIPALQQLFSSPANYPDAITFTSASTATNLFTLLEAAGLTLPPNIVLASIGPITSRTLRDLGHPSTVEAAEPTIPALIQSLLAHLESL